LTDRDRRALSLIGLGLKAGRVAVGVDAAHAALQRAKAEAIVMPKDAGPRARERLVALAGHKQVPVLIVADAEQLGTALGRPPVHGVAVLDRQLVRGLAHLLGGRDQREMAAG
jgi:ribosomal protein L7Ae-like RNA K-turn-binding protein